MKIEKGIPIPERRSHQPRESKYPFAKMDPGDSIVFTDNKQGKSALAAAYKYARDSGTKFAGRSAKEGPIRIWRVE